MKKFLVYHNNEESPDLLVVERHKIKITTSGKKHTFTYEDDGNGVHIKDSRTNTYLDYGTLADLLVALTVNKEMFESALMSARIVEQGPEQVVEF